MESFVYNGVTYDDIKSQQGYFDEAQEWFKAWDNQGQFDPLVPGVKKITDSPTASRFLKENLSKLEKIFPDVHTYIMELRMNKLGQIDHESGLILTAYTTKKCLDGFPNVWENVATQLITDTAPQTTN